MDILNILSTVKKMTIKRLKELIFETYSRQTEFYKGNSYYPMKH